MIAQLLLIIEVSVFLMGFAFIFKRERLFGIYYFFLFLYAIIAQIGYFYFPELSEYIKAYFGEDVWYEATVVIILSSLFIFIGFVTFWPKLVRLMPLTFRVTKSKYSFLGKLFVFLIFFMLAFQLSYLIFNYEIINWYTNQDENFRSENLSFSLFIFLFKLSVGVNVVIYGITLDRLGSLPKWIYIILTVVSISIFVATAIKLGNRTDLLAFGLGVLVYHLYRDRFNLRTFLLMLCASILLGLIMYLVESSRYNDSGVDLNFWAGIVTKDWYAPAHMLFAAIKFNSINPGEVILSNFSNSLILIGYPYLQQGITELFNPGVATRSAGYAFYIFTEGYMMLGGFGFIYNSLFILINMAIWRKLASTNVQEFNNIMLGLMGCMMVNLVRGQGSYFVKYLYTFVLPSIYLYAVLADKSLVIIIKGRLLK
jgi:hypothetical protein